MRTRGANDPDMSCRVRDCLFCSQRRDRQSVFATYIYIPESQSLLMLLKIVTKRWKGLIGTDGHSVRISFEILKLFCS